MRTFLAVIFLASLTLACSLSTRWTAQQTPEGQDKPSSGLIAYVGTDGNIYIVGPEGENQKAVTRDALPTSTSGGEARLYQQPTWSPDGQHLAFLGFSGKAGALDKSSLYTVAASGNDLVEAFTSTEYFPFYLYWTPDSQSISFLSNGSSEDGLVLHLAAAEGGKSSILGVGQPFYWAWSPSSDVLVVHTGGAFAENPEAKLAYLTPAGASEGKSIALQPAAFQAPDWSKDGDRIVVAAESGEGKGILALTEKDGSQREVLAEFEGPVTFSLSPDGHLLAYTLQDISQNDPTGFFKELVVLNLEDSAQSRHIVRDVIVGFFWSPDSHSLAYFAPALSSPGSSKETAPLPVEIQLGLYLADVRNGETRRLAVFSPTSAFIDILPFYDQYQRSTTIWSPDSQRIVYSSVDQNGEEGIYVVQASGEGVSERIASGNVAFWSWK